MRIVFMGTPEFSVPVFERVCEEHEVVAAYTRADSASGRGKELRPSPVKVAALSHGVPVRTPKTLRDDEQVAELRALRPDVVVTSAYGLILPQGVLEAPKHCCINAHASLLPRWRGAAPIQRAILSGDERSGICVMRMDAGLDTGDVCLRGSIDIDGMDAEELTLALSKLAAGLVSTALAQIDEGIASWSPQGDDGATYADKISKAEVKPSPELSTVENMRRVRASNDSARARASICGRPLAILKVEDAACLRGDMPGKGCVEVAGSGLLLGTADGAMLATKVRPDGKADMDAAAWARGVRGGAMAWEALQ